MNKIILASASPRRRELLQQIGVEFEVMPSECEEVVTTQEPEEAVRELSYQKAADVMKKVTEQGFPIVLGADTIVAYDGMMLGKPQDDADACRMLRMLQGNTHQVYTGVTLMWRSNKRVRYHTFAEKTEVTMYPMTEDEIQAYAATGECRDKAGAYAIQGRCAAYIQGICGDYNNVVGLPAARVYHELIRLKTKGVIFDLDGTLADTIASIQYCANEALARFGFRPYGPERYKRFVGDGAARLVERCLKTGGDEQLQYFDRVYEAYRELFAEHCMYQVAPYAGIPALLEQLKKQGIKICVLSNKPHEQAVEVVETIFGKGCFDVIAGQSPDRNRKPSPDGVNYILDELKLQPEDILYVGDTATDMQTGKRAGAFTIGVLWGFREREELEANHADAIIESPEEIMRYLIQF